MANLNKQVELLLQVITSNEYKEVKSARNLKLGKLYCFVYDAKTKAKLPVWDQLPLVILLDVPDGKYMLGINIHYLEWSRRIQMMKYLQSRGTRITYGDIKRAFEKARIPMAQLAFCIRKYIITRIQSNVKIFDDAEDQLKVVRNVLPEFQKMSMRQVYGDYRRKMADQKRKITK